MLLLHISRVGISFIQRKVRSIRLFYIQVYREDAVFNGTKRGKIKSPIEANRPIAQTRTTNWLDVSLSRKKKTNNQCPFFYFPFFLFSHIISKYYYTPDKNSRGAEIRNEEEAPRFGTLLNNSLRRKRKKEGGRRACVAGWKRRAGRGAKFVVCGKACKRGRKRGGTGRKEGREGGDGSYYLGNGIGSHDAGCWTLAANVAALRKFLRNVAPPR